MEGDSDRPGPVVMATDPISRLSKLLARLPGIGEKSALRLAMSLARADSDYAKTLADAIVDVSTSLRECAVCCDLTEAEVCPICSDARRDPSIVCVVTFPQDRIAIDKAAVFRGRYHVLHGLLDPLAGVGPSDLRLPALLERLRDGAVTEVIAAMSPSVEGDVTALYLANLLRPCGVKVTRIASGIAVGSEVEYADMSTLHHALEHRRAL